MKKKVWRVLGIVAVGILVVTACNSLTQKDPWTKDQLLEPEVLAKTISDPTQKQPVILSIGESGNIKGSVELHAAGESQNLEQLRTYLTKVEKNADIVIYCGCCPFEHCPNVRPAFALLNEMGFKHHKLLNLTHNMRVDWIEKHYPTKD